MSAFSITELKADNPKQALKVGDLAPNFELLNQEGKKVSLKEFRGKKSVVLAFSRAHWWPHCIRQVVHLQKDYTAIQAQNADVLIVFREDGKEVDGLKLSAARSGADFNLLTDLGRKSTPLYQGLGQEFCTYIIGKDGKIKSILRGNKLVRPKADAIIKVLKTLK